MVNKYFVSEEIDRVDLEDGEWVDIKREMSAGDWERVQSELVIVEGIGLNRQQRRSLKKGREDIVGVSEDAAQNPNTSIKYNASYVPFLLANIVDWSFDRPVTPTNIRLMSDSLAQTLMQEINTKNPTSGRATT